MSRVAGLILVGVLLAAGCGREGTGVSQVVAESASPSPTPLPTSTPEPVATATPVLTPAATTPAVATPEPTPAAWSRVDEGDFSFELPDDMEKEKIQGIDSQVGRYRSARGMVEYDYGQYSGECAQEDAPEYRDQWSRIDGRFAHESYWRGDAGDQYKFQACVYFRDVEDSDAATPGPTGDPGVTKLTLSVRSHEGWDDAERIINSIEFDS